MVFINKVDLVYSTPKPPTTIFFTLLQYKSKDLPRVSNE